MLGNEKGAIGIAFNEYQDFDKKDKKGYQIIFENGDYDGFSYDEQQKYLLEIGFNEKYSNYKFLNVGKDFQNGYFDFNCDRKILRKEKLERISESIKY